MRGLVRGAAVGIATAIAATLVLPVTGSAAPAAGVATTITVAPLPAGPDRFVDAAYHDFLGRTSDPAGRGYWVRKLRAGATHTSVTWQVAHSNEWTVKVVRRQFAAIVGREPTSSEQATWVAPLRSGSTNVAELISSLYGSRAYYTQVGSTAGDWVDGLYHAVVFRSPSSSERSAAIARLGSTSRSTEARRLVLSLEANGFRVDDLYGSLLRRGSDPSGRTYWSKKLTSGDDLRLASQLAGSAEYDRRAQERITTGTLAKPATTAVVSAAAVHTIQVSGDSQPSADSTDPLTAEVVVDSSSVPTGTTHVSIPATPDHPDGFLGSVTSRSDAGATTTLGLEATAWNQAFTSGEFSAVVDVPQPNDSTVAAATDRASNPAADPACSGSGNSFSLKAHTSFGLEVKAGWGPLSDDYVSFAAKGSMGADVDLLLGGAFSCSYAVTAWTIPFAIGPIAFTADIKPAFTVKGEIGAHLSGSVTLQCTAGAEWREGVTKNLTSCSKEHSTSELLPSLAEGKIAVNLGIGLAVKAYGVLGLQLDAGPSVTAAVTPLATPWWKVTGGAKASLKLVLDAWILSAEMTLADFECCTFTIAEAKGAAPEPEALAITTTELTPATRSYPYTASLAGVGGIGPFTWSASGLPAGLTVDPDTGRVHGTTTASPGTYTPTITLTDIRGASTARGVSLPVAAEPWGAVSGSLAAADLHAGTITPAVAEETGAVLSTSDEWSASDGPDARRSTLWFNPPGSTTARQLLSVTDGGSDDHSSGDGFIHTIALSPDGATAAVNLNSWTRPDGNPDRSSIILISTATGSEIARKDLPWADGETDPWGGSLDLSNAQNLVVTSGERDSNASRWWSPSAGTTGTYTAPDYLGYQAPIRQVCADGSAVVAGIGSGLYRFDPRSATTISSTTAPNLGGSSNPWYTRVSSTCSFTSSYRSDRKITIDHADGTSEEHNVSAFVPSDVEADAVSLSDDGSRLILGASTNEGYHLWVTPLSNPGAQTLRAVVVSPFDVPGPPIRYDGSSALSGDGTFTIIGTRQPAGTDQTRVAVALFGLP